MGRKQMSRLRAYLHRDSTTRSSQTGDQISARNNNSSFEDSVIDETNVENANRTGIGDSGIDGEKLTNFTQNHSADA